MTCSSGRWACRLANTRRPRRESGPLAFPFFHSLLGGHRLPLCPRRDGAAARSARRAARRPVATPRAAARLRSPRGHVRAGAFLARWAAPNRADPLPVVQCPIVKARACGAQTRAVWSAFFHTTASARRQRAEAVMRPRPSGASTHPTAPCGSSRPGRHTGAGGPPLQARARRANDAGVRGAARGARARGARRAARRPRPAPPRPARPRRPPPRAGGGVAGVGVRAPAPATGGRRRGARGGGCGRRRLGPRRH